MRRAAGLLAGLLLLTGCWGQSGAGCGGGGSIDAVQLGGVLYGRWDDLSPPPPEARRLDQADLGTKVGEIRLRHDYLCHRRDLRDLEATGLEAGTPVYEVKGHPRRFRLAAPHPSGGLAVYEPWHDPAATTGADLLALAGKVRSVVLDAPESRRRHGAITDPAQVRRLVDAVLAARVEERPFGGGTTVLVGFLLRGGTAVTRAADLDEATMMPDLVLPAEAVRILRRVAGG
jgi:hypothetical protein